MNTQMKYTPVAPKNGWAGTGFYTNIGCEGYKKHSGLWFFSDVVDFTSDSPNGYCLKRMSLIRDAGPGNQEVQALDFKEVSGVLLSFDDCSVEFVRCEGEVVLTINQ